MKGRLLELRKDWDSDFGLCMPRTREFIGLLVSEVDNVETVQAAYVDQVKKLQEQNEILLKSQHMKDHDQCGVVMSLNQVGTMQNRLLDATAIVSRLVAIIRCRNKFAFDQVDRAAEQADKFIEVNS